MLLNPFRSVKGGCSDNLGFSINLLATNPEQISFLMGQYLKCLIVASLTASSMTQVLQRAEQTQQLYSVTVKKVSEAREVGARGGATISEALLIGALTDEKLSRAAKARKIQTQLDKVTSWSGSLHQDVRALVHKKVLKESVSFLTD